MRTKMYSFGENWKAYENVYNEISPNKDKSIPGPGEYSPSLLNNSLKISLKPKISNGSIFNCTLIPGPGTYNVKSTFETEGQMLPSKFLSPLSSKFNKGKRFKLIHSIAPGPGQYTNISKASQHTAKYKSSQAHSFGKLKREITYIEKGRLESPGPGIYTIPSEFGSCSAKGAMRAKSRERTKERAKTAYSTLLHCRHNSEIDKLKITSDNSLL